MSDVGAISEHLIGPWQCSDLCYDHPCDPAITWETHIPPAYLAFNIINITKLYFICNLPPMSTTPTMILTKQCIYKKLKITKLISEYVVEFHYSTTQWYLMSQIARIITIFFEFEKRVFPPSFVIFVKYTPTIFFTELKVTFKGQKIIDKQTNFLWIACQYWSLYEIINTIYAKTFVKEDVIFKKFLSKISPKSFYASEIPPLDSITIDNLNYNK